MSINGIIADIMEREGVSQVELAKRIGITRQSMHAILKGDDMRVSTVIKIIRPLGYEFIIEKRRNSR